MHGFQLTSRQRRRLRTKLKYVKDAREAKRILALLALDRGTPLAEVAAEIGVTRQTVYNWIERFDADDNPDGLRDRAGRGRLPALSKPARQFLEWSLDQPPDALGYPSVLWTASLLREHLSTWMEVRVSVRTLRRTLHRLDCVWKRPRYALRPDPEREKKTRNSPTDQATSER